MGVTSAPYAGFLSFGADVRPALTYPSGAVEDLVPHFLSEKFCLVIDSARERQRVDWASPLLQEFAVLFPPPSLHDTPPPLPAGRCFENALSMAVISGVVYCEGFLRGVNTRTGTPTVALHAWCYLPAYGVTIDPTEGFSVTHPEVSYMGIPFATAYARHQAKRQGFYRFLDGHPSRGDQWGPYQDHSAWWLHPCWSSLERYHGPF